MSVGRAASARPLDRDFGYGRGKPVDRYFIDAFLSAHSADVKGRVLEIKDDAYSRRFGGDRITQQDVLDVDAGNANATIVADLTQSGALPTATFDCILLTQTLQYIPDLQAALLNLRASLRAGGVLLITAPGISPIPPEADGRPWRWSLSETALQSLLLAHFEEKTVEVSSFGNLYTATAFLHGAAVEDISERKLGPNDPWYPVIVAARASA
jgi:SAM-dependent methyltransferase